MGRRIGGNQHSVMLGGERKGVDGEDGCEGCTTVTITKGKGSGGHHGDGRLFQGDIICPEFYYNLDANLQDPARGNNIKQSCLRSLLCLAISLSLHSNTPFFIFYFILFYFRSNNSLRQEQTQPLRTRMSSGSRTSPVLAAKHRCPCPRHLI